MRVLEKLTIASLRENKRRTLVTVLGVMLSSALILAVVGMVTSLQKMMIDWTIADIGDYHEMYEEVPVENLKYLEDNVHVEKYFYSNPLNRNELGDDVETYELYQQMPYKAKQYQPLETLPPSADGKYNIYVRYDQPKNYEQIRTNILETLAANGTKDINVRTNDELLRYEGVMGDSALSVLYGLATIVIGIIVVTSIFVIRNSFSISATERSRQFGMLSSVGATPRQIRQNVLFEGLIIAALGIPLGIALGVVAVLVLVMVMNILLSGMMVTSVGFAMPLWVFPLVIALSLATVILSSLIPAIRASKISPIDAIRGSNDTKIKARKLRTPGFIHSFWGIGGVIAYKNLKRSRKKYRTTVISIVLSVATFVGLSSFIDYGQKTAGTMYSNSDIDLVVGGGDIELYRDLVDKFNIKDYAYYGRANVLDTNLLFANESYFKEFAKTVGINTQNYDQVVIFNDLGLVSENPGQYRIERMHPDLVDGGELEIELLSDFNSTDITIEASHNGDHVYRNVPTAEGEKIKVKFTKITDQKPIGLENSYNTVMLLSENHSLRDKIGVDSDTYQFFTKNVEDVKPIISYLEEVEASGKYEQLFYEDVKEIESQSRRIFLLISIFLYGFVIVVTLIGVTNIFNTITTNIALRAKEFAMLRSIGMTDQEFKHMVRLESLMYAGKALIIGLPIGFLISYGIYRAVAEAMDYGYIFPWLATLISIVAVGILISIIMRYSVKQVEKQNIIETIRADNI